VLCHGAAGNLETLLVASQVLKKPHLEELILQRARTLLDRIPAAAEQNARSLRIEPLVLMTGLAVIGYELLRVSRHERVPYVRALASPGRVTTSLLALPPGKGASAASG
jgi:lantibiotic modifying enzyme